MLNHHVVPETYIILYINLRFKFKKQMFAMIKKINKSHNDLKKKIITKTEFAITILFKIKFSLFILTIKEATALTCFPQHTN